jgi:hypothetical protein
MGHEKTGSFLLRSRSNFVIRLSGTDDVWSGMRVFLPPIQGRNGEFLVVPLAFKWARMKGDPLTCTADTNEIINTAINQWNRAGLGEDMRILHSGIVIFYQPDR